MNESIVINFRNGDTRGTCHVTFKEGDMPAVVAYHLCDLAKQVLALERSNVPPEPRMKDPPPPPITNTMQHALELIAGYKLEGYVSRMEAFGILTGIAKDALRGIQP